MSKKLGAYLQGGRDPGDTRAFLQNEGWELIEIEKGRERWFGYFEKDGERLPAGLVKTASGKRKFFVKNPSKRFVRAAHHGGCMLEKVKWKERDLRGKAYDDVFQVHFEVEPTAWIDGIRRLEAMM